jgi:hypothetical protein
VKEMVQDPFLKDFWIWHAYKQVLRVDGQEEEEFLDHPMNAQATWDFEVSPLNYGLNST